MPRRDDVVIATKVYYPMGDAPNDRGLSRKHIMSAIDASLRRLGTDYVDLYQIHRWDPETPIEETLLALHDIVRAGKAPLHRRIEHVCVAVREGAPHRRSHGWTRFVSMQNHYNLVYREEEREMMPLCIEEGIGVIPWSPLARGFLAGNRRGCRQGRDGARENRRLRAQACTTPTPTSASWIASSTVAKARGVTPAQIALAWILHKPAVTAPIVGASKMEQLDQAIAALDIQLTAEEIRELEETVPATHGAVVRQSAFARSASARLATYSASTRSSDRRVTRAAPAGRWPELRRRAARPQRPGSSERSVGVSPNNKALRIRVEPAAAGTPRASPTPTSINECRITIHRTVCGSAPSAIRTPISGVRRATV